MSGKKCSSSGGRVGGLWLGKNGYGWSQGKMENNNNNGKWKVCMCMESTEKYGARRMENGEWSEQACRFLSEDCHSRPKITGEMVVAAP